MNRILGIFAVSSTLLTACGGGGIQSPDFQPVLKGIFISSASESTPSTNTVTVAPSATLQLVGQGLYSIPPGTKSSTPGLFDCDGNGPLLENCTLGTASGVTFSIDPPSDNRTLATVTTNGLVTGVRRGPVKVRARLGGFTDATRDVRVDGPVLRDFVITARDVKNNKPLPKAGDPVATVPTGRVIELTAKGRCDASLAGSATVNESNCINFNYNFSWSLPLATQADTVEFTPNPAAGRIIAVKTKRFGPFRIEARINNEEGDLIENFVDARASERVLDDIVVTADPVQQQPVTVLRGTQTRFTARGNFSDGTVGEITSADLVANNLRPDNAAKLFWSQDNAAVGGPITIDEGSSTNNVASSVLVTASSGALVGGTGITATGFNKEMIPAPGTPEDGDPLQVDDRASISIQDAGLIRLTRICLNQDLGTACTNDIQIPLSQVIRLKARGQFQNDAAGVERDIDPAIFPIVFSAAPDDNQTNIAVNGDADGDGDTDSDDAGSVRGDRLGVATVVVALGNNVAPLVLGGDREARRNVTVSDSRCFDQLLLSNQTAASTAGTDGGNTATNAGNVIDFGPLTAGTFSINAAGLLDPILGILIPSEGNDPVSMIFRRDGTLITPPPTGQSIGFVLGRYSVNEDFPSDLATIITLSPSGAEVERFESPAASSFTEVDMEGSDRYQLQATARLPFSGIQLQLRSPDQTFIDALIDGDLPGLIATIIGGGGFDVDVFSACAKVRP